MSEIDTEQQDATNLDEEQELDETLDDTGEDVEALKAKAAEKEAFAKQAIARAKKAEAELKAFKAKSAEATPNLPTNNLDADAIDVKILESQGLSEDRIEYLKKLAKVNGTSILAAQKDPIYISFNEQKEREEKSQAASVGASRGSGASSKKKGFNTPGISDEDHKALWRAEQGR